MTLFFQKSFNFTSEHIYSEALRERRFTSCQLVVFRTNIYVHINQNLCTTFDFNKRMNRKSFHFMRIPIYNIAFLCVRFLSSSVCFFMSFLLISHMHQLSVDFHVFEVACLFAIAATSFLLKPTFKACIFGVRSVFFNFYSSTTTHTIH